jgi:hypothetical protein
VVVLSSAEFFEQFGAISKLRISRNKQVWAFTQFSSNLGLAGEYVGFQDFLLPM